MKERFQGSDYRFIVVCVALLAGTTWFSARNFYRAFPEASIDFRVNREQGRTAAERFLTDQGYKLGAYREASSFSFDDDAKTFLEREAGLERANQLMSTRVHMWRWSYRWFRPQQKEEFDADITTGGAAVGFSHELAEDAARPAIGAQEARAMAEEFLRTRMGRDPSTLEFVEVSETAHPHRVDREYTWKERDFDLHDATNRVEVTLLGNEIGGYREYLKVPEQWTRDYERLRSKNQIAQIADTAVMVALVLGLVVVIVLRVRRHDIRWRRASIVGVAGMVLSFFSTLNQFTLQEFQYPTTDSYPAFVSRQLLQAILTALATGGFLFVLTAGAEPIYREFFPGKVSLGNLFRPHGLRTKRFFLGAILGITLTGIFIAYQTAFYIVAYKFGAWSPADVPYSDLLNTRFPWLFVLFGGFFPAIFEEFLFRMFAIPFLKKLTRSLAIAVVLAGFIWGFGHAGYPQQPFFIRGVEVGIGGVALGLIMLRWGILPTLVWHYSVDAMYSAMLLVRSQSLYFKLSGAASAGIIVLPVLIALAAYWRRGGFEPETGLLNGDEEKPEELPAEAPAAAEGLIAYRPISLQVRLAAVALAIVGGVALLIPVSRFGDSPVYKITAEQARASADAFLREQGFDTGPFEHVTFPQVHWGDNDSMAGKYFLERLPVAAASRLFEQNRPVQYWATRYFKSLDKEEVTVSVHPETAKVMAFNHSLPEDRPGADIPEEQARSMAAAFARAQGRDVSGMELKENGAEKKKARRDYDLEWEAPPGDARNVDEAHYRVRAVVSGDQVTAFGNYWKIPETFSRAREQQNFISIAVTTLRIAMLSAAVVWGLVLLIQKIRKGLVPWKPTILIGMVVGVLTAVGSILQMPVAMEGYNTAIDLGTYKATLYVVMVMAAIFGFLIAGSAAALVTSFYPDCLRALRAVNRRRMAADAGVAILAAAGLALLLNRVEWLLMDRFHASAVLGLDSPDLLITIFPALGAISGAVRSVVLDSALVALLAVIAQTLSRNWMRVGAGLLAVFALMPSSVHSAGELGLGYAMAAATGLCAVAFCWWFARDNYLAYVLVIWGLKLREPLAQLFGTPIRAYQVQGWIVAGALLLALIWGLAPALTGESRGAETVGAQAGV